MFMKRYQTRLLDLSVPLNIDYQEFIALLISKGLIKMAVFKGSTDQRFFCIFDKPRDFKIEESTQNIISPSYITRVFRDIRVVTLSDNKADYKESVDNFEQNYNEMGYEPLLVNELGFYFDLTIKDLDHFSKIYPVHKNYKLSAATSYQMFIDFGLCRTKIEEDIDVYNKMLPNINQQLQKVLEERAPEIPYKDFEPLSNYNKNTVEKSSSMVSVSKPSEEAISEEMDPSHDLNKKYIDILENDLLTKENLEYYISLSRARAEAILNYILTKNSINITSERKNRTLRLIAMYYNKKAYPKSTDSNIWIKNCKYMLPPSLQKFFQKILEK